MPVASAHCALARRPGLVGCAAGCAFITLFNEIRFQPFQESWITCQAVRSTYCFCDCGHDTISIQPLEGSLRRRHFFIRIGSAEAHGTEERRNPIGRLPTQGAFARQPLCSTAASLRSRCDPSDVGGVSLRDYRKRAWMKIFMRARTLPCLLSAQLPLRTPGSISLEDGLKHYRTDGGTGETRSETQKVKFESRLVQVSRVHIQSVIVPSSDHDITHLSRKACHMV